jgi:D-alanyl-D-alanine carboxypeptidase
MKPRLAAWCPAIAIPVSAVVWLAASGSPAIENADVTSTVDRLPPSATADADPAKSAHPIAFGKDEIEPASGSVVEAAGDVSQSPQEPESTITVALGDSSDTQPLDRSPEQTANETTGDPGPDGAKTTGRTKTIDSVEILDECFVVDICMDRYLWALYQRTPKQDTVAEHEQRKVTVKKRGKLVTVTRTITTHVDEDFAWKDRKAAERAGMSMMDYVVGGVDQSFKRKLFHMLHAADEAGLSPGITSAFRDNYRQSIASGQKAADDRSYHGGSLRGGYGHGLAADVVSVRGETRAQRWASTETFWKWIDAHGQEFGIGRPYLDRDAPHIAPVDGKEYADHHPSMRTREASKPHKEASKAHKSGAHHKVAARNHGVAKRTKTARSSKGRTI